MREVRSWLHQTGYAKQIFDLRQQGTDNGQKPEVRSQKSKEFSIKEIPDFQDLLDFLTGLQVLLMISFLIEKL